MLLERRVQPSLPRLMTLL